MKRLLVAFPMVLCFAAAASSQSLAEVAEKERERREENARLGNTAAVQAEAVGSFGQVWWRVENVKTPTAAPRSVAPPPSEASDTEVAQNEVVENDTSVGRLSRRGYLPLRKSSARRR